MTITLRVRRSDPARGERPAWRSYRVELRPKMSVLDALFAILEEQDATLAFRYSCRAGMCGSCAMVIDGREGLACQARFEGARRSVVHVEPLRSLPVLRDLVVDMGPFFARYRAIDPFFVGEEPSLGQPPGDPAVVDPDAGVRPLVSRQIDCIACGACLSACPTVAMNDAFLGPAALNRAFALTNDARDRAHRLRREAIYGEGGVHACHSVGNCARVCPAGVDPLLSIRMLRAHAPE
ncbi:MAG: succinate dehydrogenase/fumarate reductase iron-sulfur subunit [bacterium]|nr:succinate dehydrogenase/fumarate reductase iron-sulfur subunit [bacterium]